MDASVKQILEGFDYSVNNYADSLGPDNAKLREAKKLLEGLWKRAKEGADITAISTDPGFARLGALLGELASETPAKRPEPAASGAVAGAGAGAAAGGGEIPAASVPAAGYHLAYNALPPAAQEKQKKYYDRIFQLESQAENAVFFNTMLMEDGVLLRMSQEPLIESAKDTLEKSREAYSPTVDFQQKLAAETYARAETVAELEFEGTRMAELSNVEHEWDALFIEVIGLLPACAQAIEAFGPTDDNVGKLKNSYRFMAEFMGIGWEEVFANERYLYFWNNVLWPRIPAAKRAKYAVTTPEGYRDVLKGHFFDPYIKDEPAPKKNPDRKIRFWRKEYPVEEVMRLLENPPRPVIDRDRE
ncbi:MAG: hypothetical protein JXA20_17330 [Spirochaetes bacterium]|nr:hypothetical protein [Spirochaetota bacterium]